MIRKALLIGNNVGKGASVYLRGVTIDLFNYRNYLRSDIGGGWIDGIEIEVLHNKGKREILNAINECSDIYEYSFVVFSGHGYFSSKHNTTFALVKDGAISEDDLNTGLDKQTLILDCCREVSSLTESLEGLRGDILKKGGVAPPIRRIINARKKFDIALSKSSFGTFTGYACMVDELSGDNPTEGGVFSNSLIRTGRRFGSRNQSLFSMPIRQAVIKAKTEIRNNPFSSQTPTYSTVPSMKLTHPFAITNLIS